MNAVPFDEVVEESVSLRAQANITGRRAQEARARVSATRRRTAVLQKEFRERRDQRATLIDGLKRVLAEHSSSAYRPAR